MRQTAVGRRQNLLLYWFFFLNAQFFSGILSFFKIFNFKIFATFKFLQFGFSDFCKTFRNVWVFTIRLFGFLQNFPLLSSFDNLTFRFYAKHSATFKFRQFGFSVLCKLSTTFKYRQFDFSVFMQHFPQLSSFDNSVFRFSVKLSATFKYQQFSFSVSLKFSATFKFLQFGFFGFYKLFRNFQVSTI